MVKSKTTTSIDRAAVILGALIMAGIIVSYAKGGWEMIFSGFVRSSHLLETIWLRLLLGFMLGGFIQGIVPKELVKKWIGSSSGIKGILIGSYGGLVGTGGPYVWLPVVASFLRAGAGIGPVLAMITARGILSLQMLIVWQVPFFGTKLAMSKYLPCLLVPPVVGVVGAYVFRFFKWSQEAVEEDNPQIDRGEE